MKKHVVRSKDTITLNIGDSEKKAVWDTAIFRSVDEKTLKGIFNKNFEVHKLKLLELAMSQLALDSAMVTVDAAIKQHMQEAMVMREDSIVESVDRIFTNALTYYAVNVALQAVLPDEVRIEILKSLDPSGKKVISQSTSNPAASAYMSTRKDLEGIIKNIQDNEAKSPNAPYGDPTIAPKKGKRLERVGAMKQKRNVRSDNSRP